MEALQAYRDHSSSIAFIFMDLIMPLLDGWQTTLKVRKLETANGWRTPVPIVAYTSEDVHKGSPLWQRCIQSGMNDVVVSADAADDFRPSGQTWARPPRPPAARLPADLRARPFCLVQAKPASRSSTLQLLQRYLPELQRDAAPGADAGCSSSSSKGGDAPRCSLEHGGRGACSAEELGVVISQSCAHGSCEPEAQAAGARDAAAGRWSGSMFFAPT